MASINNLLTTAGMAQQPQTIAALGQFDPRRFAPDNAASPQTIANLAPGMELAARKTRTPYIVEPTLSEQIASSIAASIPGGVFGMGISLPDDAELKMYDFGNQIVYKGTDTPVPIAPRNSVVPISRAPNGDLTATLPGGLDILSSLLPGPKGAVMAAKTAGPAVSQTIENLGRLAQDARPAGQTLEDLARAAPTRAVDTPQTVANLAEMAPAAQTIEELTRASRSNGAVGTSSKALPPKPQRPFADDYKNGTVGLADETGKLTHDIDGKPLGAEFVAGRRVVGGPDVPISPDAFDPIARGAIGAPPLPSAKAKLPSGASGAYVDEAGADGRVRRILYDQNLTGTKKDNTISHEVAHMVDELSGQIPTKGIANELKQLYSTRLDGRERTRHLTGPEALKYKGDDIPREYMAEAIQTYIDNPNYIKTMYPKVAERIRAYANRNPKINQYIQFNANVPAGPLAGLLRDSQGP